MLFKLKTITLLTTLALALTSQLSHAGRGSSGGGIGKSITPRTKNCIERIVTDYNLRASEEGSSKFLAVECEIPESLAKCILDQLSKDIRPMDAQMSCIVHKTISSLGL